MYEILGYELTSHQIAALILAYLTVSVLAIIIIPIRAVHAPRGKSLESQAKLIELRAKIRQSVVQVVGGVTAIAAFIITLQQIRQNEDTFKGKKADLFSKSITTLFDDAAGLNKRVGAMYLLSYVAGSDPSYHRTVFDTLAGYIVSLSAKACKGVDKSEAGYRREPQIQLAMRIIGERKPEHDPTGKRFNIENACLVEADLRDETGVVKGLRRVRLSNSQMLRSDFTNVDLSGAELRGVAASDYLNPGWDPAMGLQLNRGADGDNRNAIDYAPDTARRQFVTHFVGANLTSVNFQAAELAAADFTDADLSGANFLYANISRARFVGAKNLKADQIKAGCVGQPGMSAEELKEQQPYFSATVRGQIGPSGISACKPAGE